ncbi:MAG: hypothetical protein WCK06_00900 [Actinomycetota bacterium]
MLFDLRGRGRRRTVQVIYIGLAVLMVGGLLLFGIGGAVSGGLLDAIGISSGDGGSNGGASDAFTKREQAYEKQVKLNPQNATAWAELSRVRYQIAGQGDNYDQNTGQFTAKGQAQLATVAAAWTSYLALNPPKPDANLASLMVQAFGPAGLNNPAQATTAAEIVADARPSANTFYQLAVFAYAAGQTRKAELAREKAIELTPVDQRAALIKRLDEARTQGVQASASAGTATVPTTTGG